MKDVMESYFMANGFEKAIFWNASKFGNGKRVAFFPWWESVRNQDPKKYRLMSIQIHFSGVKGEGVTTRGMLVE